MSELPMSEARASLPRVLDRVEGGEEVTITRHGRAVAVLVRPDVLRVRRASDASAEAERVAEVVRAGRHNRIPAGGGLAADRAEELVAEIRAERDAGLWTLSTPTSLSTLPRRGTRWAVTHPDDLPDPDDDDQPAEG